MAPVKNGVVPLGRPATWDDLESVSEHLIGEIVDDELRVAPRPQPPHVRVTSDLGALLAGPLRFGIGGPGGWIFRDEPRIRFGREIRVPDLAGWRVERWVTPPRRGPFTLVPDWICEVLSPGTLREDRGPKRDLYAASGVRHLWHIDPDARTLEVHRLDERGLYLVAATFTDDAKVRAEPFDAIELDLSLLWEPGGDQPLDDDE